MIKLKKRLSRNKVIFEAIEPCKQSKMIENQIREYEDGYKTMPESATDINGWVKASLVTFSDESW
jgi:hypothetical protein